MGQECGGTAMTFVERVLSALQSVLPSAGFTALHEPLFQGNEWEYVRECLDTGWVSSVGPIRG